MQKDTVFILAVALITWGGVLAYLVRLHFLTRALEAKIEAHQTFAQAEYSGDGK